MISDTLSWKSHIDMITLKLRQARFTVRGVKLFLSQDTLRMMYYANFHSIMTYGIIIWGNSSNVDRIFRLIKRIIRIIMGARTRHSCRELFNILKILPLTSQYIFSLALFVVNNKSLFIEFS